MSRAVIVSPDPASKSGGVERMCELLAGVLQSEGWSVEIIGPTAEPSRWLYRIGAGPLATSWQVARDSRRHDPDLLVTNGSLGAFSPRDVPRIHVYHGTMVGNTKTEGSNMRLRERFRRGLGAGAAEALAGRGASTVVVSEKAAAEVRRYYRIDADAVIPNGVDTELFRPRPRGEARAAMGLDPDGRYLLFVGRLQYLKGADLMVEASRRAGYTLLVAGLGEAPGAQALGILSPEELAVAYTAADAVLFPSRYEACSYVVLETLASGVPLLATRVGWMPTLLRAVPEYDALCIEPELEDIVDHLKALEQMPLEAPVRAAREWVLANNSLESYASAWKALLARPGAPQLSTASPTSL
jgi:glycosyltransferase involved in cell wall biosynthesis